MFATQDAAIERNNKRLKKAHTAKAETASRLLQAQMGAGSPERAALAVERARKQYDKALEASLQVVGSGSGKVGLLLPSTVGNIRPHRGPTSM